MYAECVEALKGELNTAFQTFKRRNASLSAELCGTLLDRVLTSGSLAVKQVHLQCVVGSNPLPCIIGRCLFGGLDRRCPRRHA